MGRHIWYLLGDYRYFVVNKKAKIAIFGAAGLAVVGLIGLGIAKFFQALEDFEMIDLDQTNELIDEDLYK